MKPQQYPKIYGQLRKIENWKSVLPQGRAKIIVVCPVPNDHP